MQSTILAEPINHTLNRRNFLRKSAIALVAAAFAQNAIATNYAFAAAPAAPLAQWNVDVDILNYALTLEHLEAEAYRIANASGLLSGAAANYFRVGSRYSKVLTDVGTCLARSHDTCLAGCVYDWP